MEQVFIEKDFQKGSLQLIELANTICNEYASEGYDLSLRQLYYQFVARNYLKNTEGNYKRLGKLVSDARLAGLIDWIFIKDRGRKIEEAAKWDSPKAILKQAAKQFRIDRWEDQTNYVLVMVEKQALEGILLPLCHKLDVGFVANKGYSSNSMMYEIGCLILEMRNDGREAHIIYLGDHDPSGLDMSRDVEERLEMFSEGYVYLHRVALNMSQVKKYNPPENPTKLSDTRAASYIADYGPSSWELDALEPKVLVSLVERKVNSLCDMEKYENMLDQERIWKAEIMKVAKSY